MIIQFKELSLQEIEPLLLESEAEGFRFLRRLRDDWVSGANRFDGPGEAFFGYRVEGRLIAVGGLNRQSVNSGRLRRVYVARHARRTGIGRSLVVHIVQYAIPFFDEIVLRTDTAGADAFYQAIGFNRSHDGGGDHTHALRMSSR
jgi:GNAT superfamily N-acetyltransferase